MIMSKSEMVQSVRKEELERYVTKTDLEILENRLETQIIRAENKILAFILGVIVLMVLLFKLQ